MRAKPSKVQATHIAVPVVPLHLQHVAIAIRPHQGVQLLPKRIHGANLTHEQHLTPPQHARSPPTPQTPKTTPSLPQKPTRNPNCALHQHPRARPSLCFSQSSKLGENLSPRSLPLWVHFWCATIWNHAPAHSNLTLHKSATLAWPIPHGIEEREALRLSEGSARRGERIREAYEGCGTNLDGSASLDHGNNGATQGVCSLCETGVQTSCESSPEGGPCRGRRVGGGFFWPRSGDRWTVPRRVIDNERFLSRKSKPLR